MTTNTGNSAKCFLVTGGAGFIGSAVVRHLIQRTEHKAVCLDKLTYAGNLASLKAVAGDSRFAFIHADICDVEAVRLAFSEHRPDIVIHLAAESHVDRSIDGPAAFIQTNVNGTFTLLQVALDYWRTLAGAARRDFRFLHVSTDEVFGTLGDRGFFREDTPYAPTSPYSASKAASDHLVRAWRHTYGLPTILSNCSNNYGPYHFPEKLIPLMIVNGLEGKALPVYGAGENVRDWLFVEDHVEALLLLAENARAGESYNIGGHNERRNIDLVRAVCGILDRVSPDARIGARESLITHVADRPGHDRRYAIDAGKIEREFGWRPRWSLEAGLEATVRWYLDNREWWEAIRSGVYRGERLGIVR